jgi:hypothetical protein
MNSQSIKQHRRWLGPAALLLTMAGFAIAPPAFARIIVNTIDPEASVSDDGRHLVVTLVRTTPLDCTATERAVVRTVTQRSTGAVAEGRTIVPCTDDTERSEVVCRTRGQPAFEEGPATAVAFARASDHGQVTDAHQWLVEITLVKD